MIIPVILLFDLDGHLDLFLQGFELLQPDRLHAGLVQFPFGGIPEVYLLTGFLGDDLRQPCQLFLIFGEDIKELGRWGCSVIIKSIQHADMLSDFLYDAESGVVHEFVKPRVDTRNVNGTGDSFSSAIATYIASRYPLLDAVKRGEEFISRAISLGAEYEFGHGFGPVHPCFMENKTQHQRIYNETNKKDMI